MSLSSYLASKYLNAEPSSTNPSKKRKRKDKSTTTTGLIIADDDALGWNPSDSLQDDNPKPLTITSGSAEFRKAKKNAWKTVGIPALQPQDLEDTTAADKIVAETARENAAALREEAPVIEEEDDGVVKMGDGTHAGLQSAAAVSAQFEKRKRAELKAWEREQWDAENGAQGKKKKVGKEETVYRDATGRRIDISMRRQEARRELDEAARKEREEKEAQKGDVQRAMKEKRKEELDEARFLGVARGVDDVEMNDELKGVERWNDPAAQFLVKKKEGKSVTGRPMYKGAAQPNRYGIRPGHKWDGVDRSNGWEGERFKAMNRRTRNKELDFAWQMDE
jgi:pre-mRNA-splicing factor CWC26